MSQFSRDSNDGREKDLLLSNWNTNTFKNLLHSVDMNYRLENEVDSAIAEFDIMHLRDQLEIISKLYLDHEVPFHLIEGYRENGLDEEERKSINIMKNLSSDLNSLFELSDEVDNAIEEYDIMSFRELLSKLTKQENNLLRNIPLRSIKYIDKKK
ncbi:hypothetical protein OAT16_11345 [Prolixibacteraceae bacterium]|nr:hypothetical protein [Prolixibacteraceae bacterium]